MAGPDPEEGGQRPPTLEQRVDELEIRSAFQDRTTDDLDAVVRDFTARVARLERELKQLRAQLEQLGVQPARPDAAGPV